MGKMPYGIVVSSQKGGVGKTTVSVNLAAALNARGYSVLLIDADYANPTVGFHLGLEKVNIGLRSILNDKSDLRDAVVSHNTGIHVLPSEITEQPMEVSEHQALHLYNEISKSKYDFVIMDMAPGPLPFEMLSVFKRWNSLEVLILLTPEMSACMSAIRLAGLYDKNRIRRRFVANRVKHMGYELSIGDIEDVCGERLMGTLPEDEHVPISVANHIPLYVLKRNCRFSREIHVLSRHYAGSVGTEPGDPDDPGIGDFISLVKGMLQRLRP